MKTATDEQDIKTRKAGDVIKLYRFIDKDSVKAVDQGSGIIEATVTTSSVDRYNENIVTGGIDTSNYELNPVVLYGHDYYNFPVGKAISLKQLKNKLTAKFQLAIEEYDFAATLYKLIQGGYINAVSIGGRVLEWSEDYKSIVKMEMLEFSIVAIPANPEAMITGKAFEQQIGKSWDDVRDEFEDFSQKMLLDKLKSMPENEIEDSIRVLRTLVDRLEEAAVAKPVDDEPEHKYVGRKFVLKEARSVAEQSHKVIKLIKLKG